MLKNKLRLYPFHVFLVLPFIVLFLYGHNLGQTRPFMTYRTLLIGEGLSLLFFGTCYLLLKNSVKAGVFTTFLLFLLFQYGVIYEFFEALYYDGIWPFKNIHRYMVVLFVVIISVSFWLVKRTKHDLVKASYFLNFFIALLLVFNLFRINFGQAMGPRKLYNLKPYPKIEFDAAKKAAAPNIYYIILDGYANNAILEKYYNFKNDEFTSDLKKMNFTFCDSAFSNYYYTSQSLAATLNMNFLDELLRTPDRLHNNLLFRTLKENNYKVYHMLSGFAVTNAFLNADSTIAIEGPNEFEKSILKYTVLRLDDLIGMFAHQRLSSQFKQMYVFDKIKGHPKFSFLHFVAPHPPYIFDRDGKIRSKHNFAESSWEPKEYYIDQMVYVNKQITKLVKDIIQKDPASTIIIQSDHGPWISGNSKDELFEARSKILYAYYSKDDLHIPKTTSSVNTFRYVFNGLFNAKMPFLNDSCAGKDSLMIDLTLHKKLD